MATSRALRAVLEELAAGLTPVKLAARAVATSHVALTGLQTIDGVALAEGDRVLLTGQTAATKNGLWNASSGVWSRTEDASTNNFFVPGMQVFVTEGTTNARTQWHLTSPTVGPIRLDVTSLTFAKAIGASAAIDAAVPATASTIAQRDASGGLTAVNIYSQGVRAPDSPTANVAGTSLDLSGGLCHSSDIGERNRGHFLFRHGVCASANSYQAAKEVHYYGDSRSLTNPEWIIRDDGPIGQAGFDPVADGERTPSQWLFGVGANPTSGKGPSLQIFSHVNSVVVEAATRVQQGIRSGNRNGVFARVWPTLAPSTQGAANGHGGSVEHINRRVQTTGNGAGTPGTERIWQSPLAAVGGETPFAANEYAHCDMLLQAYLSGDTFVNYRFVFQVRGHVGVFGSVVDYPQSIYASRAGSGGNGIVSVNADGTNSRPYIDVTGWSAKTITWQLTGTITRVAL